MSTSFLSNQQILFTYYHMKTILARYDETIKNSELIQNMFGESAFQIKVRLPQDIVDDLLTSKHYQTLVAMIETLTPVAELIEDVEPELATEVKNMFI